MITISVCYSNRSGQEFASCTLGGVELGAELLDQPAVLAAAIQRAYDRCREAVATQLQTQAVADKPPAVNPVQAPAPAAIPALPRSGASTPSAPPAASRNGQSNDGPPTTARQLGGWAKARGLTQWFSGLGRANNRRGLINEWDDAFALWAYEQWLATQAAPAAPAVPSSNGRVPY
jgi:hypothetical protein